jgi:uncharacterized protein
MEIKRDFYLNRLIQRKHNGLVKVVTGVRRCGKSYLLSLLFKDHLIAEGVTPEHIIEMAFDVRENKKYRDPDVFDTYAKEKIVDDKMHYFLLDEVQLLDDFESVLNGLIRHRNVDVYVTGSNAKFLSKDVITEFRGRGDEIHMRPLSFAEFMTVYDGDRYQGFEDFILYGGLPPVVLLHAAEEKVDFLERLFKETYISDIVGRNRIRNVSEMEELLDILASNIGTLTNPQKLQNTFRSVKNSKITSVTISKYLVYLAEAYLIEPAKRFDIRGKAYIETPLKYYYVDLGLRNARINFRQVEMTHSMENVIYNELRMRRFNVDVGCVTISERNVRGVPVRKQLEVDFVCNKGSKRYYIQSAYAIPDEAKRIQEERPLKYIDDSFKKVIITRDTPGVQYTEDGFLMMNVFEFLLNPNSLDY